MKIIKPSVEIIQEPDNMKRIELAARVCYKSEDRIAEGTAEKMCKMLIRRGHTAMLEHGNIVVLFDNVDERAVRIHCAIRKYMEDTGLPSMLRHTMTYTAEQGTRVIYSGNVRAWRAVLPYARSAIHFGDDPLFDGVEIDKPKCGDLSAFRVSADALTPAERDRHDIITARFVCAEGVSLEMFRHRIAAADYEEAPAVCVSPAQESTRYVDYNGGQIQFVEPWWWGDDGPDMEWARLYFEGSCKLSEEAYISIRSGKRALPPQAARAVLTKAVKTEIVLTQTPERWREWLALREAKDAHPDMQICARLFREAAEGEGLL
jgi:thymidylate synthase ThyX